MVKLTFSKFYNYQGLTDFLKGMEVSYPNLISLLSLAKTPEGREVWCAKVTSKDSNIPIRARPGYLALGNMHSIELAGSMACLYLLERLVRGYEKEEHIKDLLNRQVFYIIPRLSMDGAEYSLTTLRNVRSRRIDLREKNVVYPEDLDGDGKILSMRWQAPDGDYKLSSKDPRLTIPRNPWDWEGPFYHMWAEGLIHDWDGESIESSRIWPDFNRDFPANWQPAPEVIGHGDGPLSNPETKGLAEFVLSRPNIINAIDFHTGNSAVFIPTAAIEEKADSLEDADFFRTLGKRAQAITGFPLLGGYDEIKMGPPSDGVPGTFKDWLYEHLGIVPFLMEMGVFYNYLGVSTEEYFYYDNVSQREERLGLTLLEWHDDNPKYGLFFDWKPHVHAQLGPVELGGWNWVLRGNPPLSRLRRVCRKAVTFILEHANYIPQLHVSSVKVSEVSPHIFELIVEITNRGKLPTNITKRGIDIRPAPKVSLTSPEDFKLIEGENPMSLGHLIALNGRYKARWVIGAHRGMGIWIEVNSEKGVYIKKNIKLVPSKERGIAE